MDDIVWRALGVLRESAPNRAYERREIIDYVFRLALEELNRPLAVVSLTNSVDRALRLLVANRDASRISRGVYVFHAPGEQPTPPAANSLVDPVEAEMPRRSSSDSGLEFLLTAPMYVLPTSVREWIGSASILCASKEEIAHLYESQAVSI